MTGAPTKRGGRESGEPPRRQRQRSGQEVSAAANTAACIHYRREGEPCPQCAAESRIRDLETELAVKDSALTLFIAGEEDATARAEKAEAELASHSGNYWDRLQSENERLKEAERTCKAANESQRRSIEALEAERAELELELKGWRRVARETPIIERLKARAEKAEAAFQAEHEVQERGARALVDALAELATVRAEEKRLREGWIAEKIEVERLKAELTSLTWTEEGIVDRRTMEFWKAGEPVERECGT